MNKHLISHGVPALRTISGSKEQLLPPRPQLQCPECTFENDNPEHLSEHLIQAHRYSLSAAWFAAGQENERLYPRFRAPAGTFCVLGVNKTVPTGQIIATCTSLNEAIVAAVQEAGSYPEISIHDDSGKELYQVIPKPTDETQELRDAKEDKGVDNPTDKSKYGPEPRRVIIATMPTFKRHPPEGS